MKKIHYVPKKTVNFVILFCILLAIITATIFTYPKITAFKNQLFNNGQVSPIEKKDKYLILVNELANQNLPVTFLNFKNDYIEASLSSGVTVIFSLDKDLISEVTSLQLILSRFRIEGRKVRHIDLRFKNAIIE